MHKNLAEVAPPFIEMAYQIVWCSAATVDSHNRPWSRVLHPIWQWDGTSLVGWIGTAPTSLKRRQLDANPQMTVNYWHPNQDTCTANCRAEMLLDEETRVKVWDMFLNGPEPVGYDPTLIPGWDHPMSEGFGVIRVEPWWVRVFPGTVLMGQGGEVLTWRE